MSKLRYAILILLWIVSVHDTQAQRRYMLQERMEHQISLLQCFKGHELSNDPDVFWGLHANQYVGIHHLFGFDVEGSWTSFVSPMPKVKITPGGEAIGGHFVYELQSSGLLFQTGIGINYQKTCNVLLDTAIYHEHMTDLWDPIEPAEYTLKHAFYERQDVSRNLYVQVPLYIGNYILGPTGVGYWLVGVKASYAFRGSTKQTMLGSTTALYEPYLGVWHEMDNHGYRKDVPIERKGERLKLRMDVLAHGEIGYEWTTYNGPHNYRITPTNRTDIRFRVAAFVEFGMVNISPRSNNVLYGIPEETIYDFPTYRMDHVFSTVDAKPYWLRNIYAGVKLTVLIGKPWKDFCITCNPWKH